MRPVMHDPVTGAVFTAADLVPQISWVRFGPAVVIPGFLVSAPEAVRRRWGMRWDGDELVIPDWWPR